MAMAQPARAHLSVHFAVVGASISGLASALALSRAGHRVTVLEQAGEHEPRPTGGLRVPPNVSKVFARWGLGAELAKIAVRSRMMRSYSCASLLSHLYAELMRRRRGGLIHRLQPVGRGTAARVRRRLPHRGV
jgi:salicylate hydroxylase